MRQLKTIDLYCGGGGFSEGSHRAGFKTLLAVDFDKAAREMYSLNFPKVLCKNMDMFKTSGSDLLREVGLSVGELDLLTGGPPCQGFSSAGNRHVYDSRNNLLIRMLDVMNEIKPKVVSVENVPGLTQGIMLKRYFEFYAKLNSMKDYVWDLKQLNAIHYSAPTNRLRNVFVAVRRDISETVSYPEPQAIDMESLRINRVAPWIKYLCYGYGFKKYKCATGFCNTITKTPNLMVIDTHDRKRKLSLEELLMFAGFPSDWKMLNSYNQNWGRIGNAVPPPLAYALTKHIRDTYFNS